jgi:hypothetical protein
MSMLLSRYPLLRRIYINRYLIDTKIGFLAREMILKEFFILLKHEELMDILETIYFLKR